MSTAAPIDKIDLVRSEAARRLQELEEQVKALASPPPSWLETNSAETSEDSAHQNENPHDRHDNFAFAHLNHAGFVKLSQFASLDECEAMKAEMVRLVKEEWNEHEVEDFGTNAVQNEARGDYFLASADRIHYFCEPAALQDSTTTNKDESSIARTKTLKPEYQSPDAKVQALNKAGHALHCVKYFDDPSDGGHRRRPNPFYDYCTSDKIRRLVHQELQWRDPVVPQSMYIFKAPRVGGAVSSHQDSTFLWTEPRQSCLGLWLALDDATLNNGCLWVRPQSHTEPVHRQYKRNPQHFGDDVIEQRHNVPKGNVETESKFVMENCPTKTDHENGNTTASQPQETPPPLDLDTLSAHELWSQTNHDYVPVECRAGDLLVFVGTLDHLSLPNVSAEQRHTFQLHLVEGPRANVTWSPYNWLQYPPGKPFLRLVVKDDDDVNSGE